MLVFILLFPLSLFIFRLPMHQIRPSSYPLTQNLPLLLLCQTLPSHIPSLTPSLIQFNHTSTRIHCLIGLFSDKRGNKSTKLMSRPADDTISKTNMSERINYQNIMERGCKSNSSCDGNGCIGIDG